MKKADRALAAAFVAAIFALAASIFFAPTQIVRAVSIQEVEGTAFGGSAVSTNNPVHVAAISSAGTVLFDLGDNAAANAAAFHGAPLSVSMGICLPWDNVVPFLPATSNGTTPVQFGPNASAGKSVIPVKMVWANESTTTVHYLTFESSGSQVIFQKIPLPIGGGFAWDNDHGAIRSFAGEALEFFIDSGGSATDVIVSGVGCQK
jgi:hypothetical protein